MDKLKKALRREKDEKTEEDGIIERANEASSMSCGTRMKAFVFCFLAGLLFSFMGLSLLWLPGLGIGVFAAFYTIGNIFALLSVMFLIGPWEQLKTMCAPERALATILMLVFIVLTVFAAFWWKSMALSLVFCGCQFLAFAWYAISYIPFARELILKCFRCCCTI